MQLGESIGLGKDILETSLSIMNDEKVKQRLRKYTEDALEYGVISEVYIN